MRGLVPRDVRLCFEGCPWLEGQMWFAERRLLLDAVRTYRPRTCVEVGTWKGGGSTYFTALALQETGQGVLHTWETDAGLFETARRTYESRLPKLAPHVSFHFGDYRKAATVPEVDCLMLDGPEDAGHTLEQLRFFEPRMPPGSVLLAHDWHTQKARLIRPLVEEGTLFRIVARVDAPVSVGFIVALKRFLSGSYAAAISPPVHDSAAASFSPRARSASPSASTSASKRFITTTSTAR